MTKAGRLAWPSAASQWCWRFRTRAEYWRPFRNPTSARPSSSVRSSSGNWGLEKNVEQSKHQASSTKQTRSPNHRWPICFGQWSLGFVCDLRIAVSCLAGLLALLIAVSRGGAADTDALRHKQQAQERARAMAGELISAVLDLQLRQ